jgi:ferrous iron transport protein B
MKQLIQQISADELTEAENKSTIALSDSKSGFRGIVRHLSGGSQSVQRLVSLGFTPGALVKVIRRGGSSGPLLVSVRGSRVALGMDEAGLIEISPVESEPEKPQSSAGKNVVIALTGQPNVGKSTVFNTLTGMHQHVGNWTGKTVDLKNGQVNFQNTVYTLVDLPGTYSLTAASEEERITRDFILNEKPDLVIAVADATNLERGLYLLAELLLLPAPVILALNMMDVTEQEGFSVEPRVLETALGIPVVPMSAAHNQGITELMETVAQFRSGKLPYHPQKPSILPAHQQILSELERILADFPTTGQPLDWICIKLLEGDDEITRHVKSLVQPETWTQIEHILYQHEDAILDIAGARYKWIDRMLRAAVVEHTLSHGRLTSRLDRVLTHPVWGTITMFVLLGGVFWLTYSVGSPIQAWLADLISRLADSVRVWLSSAPNWISELVAGGILGGLGMVLTFLPLLIIFYTVLGLLEDTGYLARIAFLADRWMHRIGLHGKSFLPLLMGFGCNVPAVLGTRIIESSKARLFTILLIPLIPCTARLAVVTFLAPVLFGSSATLVSLALVVANLLLLALIGTLLHQYAFGDEHLPFIMELPIYHLPNFKTIGLYVWNNVVGFLEKAGKVILFASVIVWGLSYFPTGNINTSILGYIGKFLEPVAGLMGMPWKVLVALLTGAVAKENTIATLGVLYGNIGKTLPQILGTASALSVLVFQMLFIPCIATVAAIRQETKSWKWTAISLVMMLALSSGIAIAVYQIAKGIIG